MRTILLVLALVPSVTVVALWAATSVQLYTDWRQHTERNKASSEASGSIIVAFFDLQEERRLSGAALADPAAYRTQLQQQRARTDASVKTVEELPDSGWSAPDDIRRNVSAVGKELRKLADYRAGVDQRSASQQQTFDRYTGLISTDLKLFTVLSNVGLPKIEYLAKPAIDSLWGLEMISREDALITRGSAAGRLSAGEGGQMAGWVGAQQFIYQNKVAPLVPDALGQQYRRLMSSDAWKQKASVEQTVLSGTASGSRSDVISGRLGKKWNSGVGQIDQQLRQLNAEYAVTLTSATDRELHSMVVRLTATAVMGAVAVLLVVLISALFTRTLRRRIFALRQAALDLQTRMPDVVERMRRGEPVDPDAELPPIQHGTDELGQLGQALNQARHSALDTTMAQVGQFRGFEKLLQRIARRTQLLIGLQMKKLSELERKHEDPEVLEGLFDLDHLTARLRRYEENLVILGGGQPQRRWRKPVLLLDVLRSAQSEVQDYRRIQIEVEGRVWLAERAVGLVVHVLAELMENAVGFSKPPTPVEVYAARVGRGLAVEIEDRGIGMDPEQYDEANRLMAEPPRLDVMSHADDVRLGLYVVSRLAQGLGLRVELRPSSFGGTRVVVLVPEELVVADPERPEPVPAAAVAAPWVDPPDRAIAAAPGPAHGTVTEAGGYFTTRDPVGEGSGPAGQMWFGSPPHQSVPPMPEPSAARPLPKRVRMASLVDELRDPAAAARAHPEEERPPDRHSGPARAGAAVGAFQRQSRMSRGAADHPGATGDADRGTADGGDTPDRWGPANRGNQVHGRTEVLPYRRRIPTED
ncbi:nitrate- and nitrite sensing domain-containing protein [Streptomyces sp. NPDC001843]|uniref:sensor histidine kinase n=1 Tax=Streptomyces sp. NPDC001843 TaxID=3364617 RepID=UPI0036781EFE